MNERYGLVQKIGEDVPILVLDALSGFLFVFSVGFVVFLAFFSFWSLSFFEFEVFLRRFLILHLDFNALVNGDVLLPLALLERFEGTFCIWRDNKILLICFIQTLIFLNEALILVPEDLCLKEQ